LGEVLNREQGDPRVGVGWIGRQGQLGLLSSQVQSAAERGARGELTRRDSKYDGLSPRPHELATAQRFLEPALGRSGDERVKPAQSFGGS
jgi:hypothetical protein